MKRLMILLLIWSAVAGCATNRASQCPIEPEKANAQPVTVTTDAIAFPYGAPEPGEGVYVPMEDMGQIMAYLRALEQAVGCD